METGCANPGRTRLNMTTEAELQRLERREKHFRLTQRIETNPPGLRNLILQNMFVSLRDVVITLNFVAL